MDRTIPFDKNEKCDECGQLGSFDFMGDCICQDCLNKATRQLEKNPESCPCNQCGCGKKKPRERDLLEDMEFAYRHTE